MLSIRRIKLEISTNDFPSNLYGFDISFKKGLNIVAGQNSKGKSTIATCIYYGLGMEELLGGLNEKVLGKALTEEFITKNTEINETTIHKITFSKVFLELENSKNEVITLRRIINSQEKDSKNNDLKTKKIIVFKSKIQDINNNTAQIPLFLRSDNNNKNEYGFYNWFSKFIGIEIPVITNVSKSNGISPLYLQTIFPALFIEQTKGWSDFLATCPYFGIAKNKEKTIEFILNLNELANSSENDRILKEERDLKEQWNQVVTMVEMLSLEYNTITNIPRGLQRDKSLLSSVSISIQNNVDSMEQVLISTLQEKFTRELQILREKSILKVGDNKTLIRAKLNRLYTDQREFIKKINAFDLNFNLQRHQEQNIRSQYQNVEAV